MTNFFNFDDLTWDEVANLPRDVPLVLPLGSGYDHAQLQNRLIASRRRASTRKVVLWRISRRLF
jgi:hypothetical protein